MIALSHDAWLRASATERLARAEALVRELPAGFRFVAMRDAQLGEQRFPVATFAWREREFSLVPGGRFELGWSSDRWNPDDDELESFQASADEYGIAGTIDEHVARATTPLRTVESAPLLVQTTAEELGWAAIELDDPDVLQALEYMAPGTAPYTSTVSRGDSQVRVQRFEGGRIEACRAVTAIHATIVTELARDGFRLATSDEWELLCGGGARTLFRWGDHAPCDRYPNDISPEESAWRREWVRSGGTLERPPEGFHSDWELHRQPNAFGLYIASDPYKYELVAEPDRTRGGDGGSTVCGGAGFFLGWLTLATAYFEDHACLRDAAEPLMAGFTIARRVLPLK